jgi:NAD(P)-dependent dehydrogenase (short-subunit alcohol dehydrogenase family)
VIVTGAGTREVGPGTGAATALVLALNGAKVQIADVDQSSAERTASAIKASGGECDISICDVTLEDDCKKTVASAIDWNGRVDALINNAGFAAGGTILETTAEQWDRVMAVNLRGAFLMSKATLQPMIDRRKGSIVNIGSIAGLMPNGVCAYSASKAGLIGLTKELAVEYGRMGIRANAICPGHLVAPMAAHHSLEVVKQRRLSAPLGIDGTIWDVAEAALFLIDDTSRFVSGAVLPVDGGVTNVMPMTARKFLTDS